MQKTRFSLLPQLHRPPTRRPTHPTLSPFRQTPLRTISDRRPQVPYGAWDSHVHIIAPHLRPIPASATYKPRAATYLELTASADKISIYNHVFVQPSVYGTDNRCQLDVLQMLGPSVARAVVAIDPATTDRTTLEKWGEMGVRGVRVNLKSVGSEMSGHEFRSLLLQHAQAIRPLRTWALQLYVDLEMAGELEAVLPQLGVKAVLDHFGGLSGDGGGGLAVARKGEAWQKLLRLVDNEGVYVKISAPYRIASDWEDLEPFFRDLASAGQGKGVVFASDWPHTRFEGVDARKWTEMCLDWCGEDEELRQNLFRKNAETLWDVDPDDSNSTFVGPNGAYGPLFLG